MDTLIATLLEMVNETLSATIVVIAASMLLYNLTRSLRDRVARTSGILLSSVTAAYVCDVFLSLNPSYGTYTAVLRLQWLGIAFMPAAMFHLSDALLATTGLPSRGRRRRVSRILYLISAVFLLLAAFSNLLIQPEPIRPAYFRDGVYASLRGGPVFPVYVALFLLATGIAFINVQRARARCLTRSTRRRMGYLQIAVLTPAVGIFPFSVLIGPGQEYSLMGLFLVNLTNVVVVFMLLFLAYPLSFFGTRIPDRVVKTELLRFMLRGPATGLLALVTIIFINPTSRILGLLGQSFIPFAVVSVVLLWQWGVALSLPYLERRLVYSSEDTDQLQKLGSLSERLLARGDLLQLLEAILASACDYLRVSSAFVATLNDQAPEVSSAVGSIRPTAALLQEEADALSQRLSGENDGELRIETWHTFWIIPLYGRRNAVPMGFMGIQARSGAVDLSDDELTMLRSLSHRAAQALDDLTLQSEIFAALEGLLPQINLTRRSAADLEYRPGRETSPLKPLNGLDIDDEQFKEQVRAALKHLWGGPGLTDSRLLELRIVEAALPENDNNPPRALRTMLIKAIEKQKPEGARKLLSPEWTLYNILDLRFLQKAKVREVAQRLALSEADLYRKQSHAVSAIADTLLVMERDFDDTSPSE
jgi:N-terminal 7TM region of histidine kinase